MGFRHKDSEGRGGYARIWKVENKGNYSIAKVSTSKKRKDGDGYETDFQHGFVRLVGNAHDKVSNLEIPDKGVAIQIISCEVTTPYDGENKKSYTNYVIYAFDVVNGENTSDSKESKSTAKTSKSKKNTPAVEELEDESDLPF